MAASLLTSTHCYATHFPQQNRKSSIANAICERMLVDFYLNLIETQRTCFLFLLEIPQQKIKYFVSFDHQNFKFPLLAPSLHLLLILVVLVSSYRNTTKQKATCIYFDHQNVNSLCLCHHYFNCLC